MLNKPVIAVTMGDPCGIGPEIIAAALADPAITALCRPLVLGDRSAMERGIAVAGAKLDIASAPDLLPPLDPPPGTLYLREFSKLKLDEIPYGAPTVAGGDACYRYICEAARLCLDGTVQAMATAPINKESMNSAGHDYPGHTELLAELTGTPEVVMMLAGERLKVTLVTIHEPLARVPELVTFDRVLSTIRITHDALSRWFCPAPRLAVLALNPHCGEGGMFGDEESRIIAPAVAAARDMGIDAAGPVSADTLFHFAAKGGYDAVVCMYHDQGLIPLKLLHFDDGVNVTLGLPIIRTSVDHGTAYDLAGTGKASAESMKAALIMAARMAQQQVCR
ncbi:4-hydroxythreonine-4-phosphate dehydrogenase PdxA [Citrifermentans bremense]|uniref:4-hydroxythreonine-4-phosphate dehydrogenase n=1 Tax=Citrifermentans bremense TaxID=60035 RepID=A0A6S6LX34_9BACT|nr:4-hydroxythreonine-4-phosphate dehydrogenase PdxA [Citrifermentans bremense]